MADQQSCGAKLKKYRGSKEEILLKSGLSMRPPDFMNLVLENCNACKGVPFSKADVTVQQYQSYRKALWSLADDSFVNVAYDQLFQYDIISKLATEGLASAPDQYKDALLTLMIFYEDIEQHQEALSHVILSYKYESEITAALANHLLSQLTTGHRYEIDKDSPHLPSICPCKHSNCKRSINVGCTNLGRNDTWHGTVDLLLDQLIPVFVLKEDDLDSSALEEDNFDSLACSVDIEDDTTLTRSALYQENVSELDTYAYHENESELDTYAYHENESELDAYVYHKNESELDTYVYHKNESELDSSDSENGPSAKKKKRTVEVKRRKIKKEDLLSLGVIDHIIAVTITNAFTQVNQSEFVKSWLIPMFGCTSDSVVVFMYDPINDVLLQSLEILPIWLDDRESCFHPNTIVVLWMLINFRLFTRPKLQRKIACKNANFFSCAKDSLALYKDMKKTSTFRACDVTSDRLLLYFRQRVQRAKDVE